MINRLSSSNFKSWEKTGDIQFSKITGFFGSNSSGKTSLLQILLMMKQTVESYDRQVILEFGSEKSYVELGNFDEIINYNNIQAPIKLELDWDFQKKRKIEHPDIKGQNLFELSNLSYKTEILKPENKTNIIVNDFCYKFDNYEFGMKWKEGNKYELIYNGDTTHFKPRKIRGRVWDPPAPIKCYGFPDQIKAYYQNLTFISDFVLEFEELFSHIYYLGPLREYPKRQYSWAGSQPEDMGRKGERVIDAILSSKEKNYKISRGRGKDKFSVEQYIAYWLKELNLIDSFEVEKIAEPGNLYSVKVKRHQTGESVYITDVGFGVSQILPVIALCYYVPEGSTLIIEQPEIHLHPSVQAGLADVFIDATKNRNIQIVFESHSEYLLKRLQRRIADETTSQSDISLYFCDYTDQNQSELHSLNVDLYGNIQNWPNDFFGDQLGEMIAITEAISQRKT